jgi:hypothetical protein
MPPFSLQVVRDGSSEWLKEDAPDLRRMCLYATAFLWITSPLLWCGVYFGVVAPRSGGAYKPWQAAEALLSAFVILPILLIAVAKARRATCIRIVSINPRDKRIEVRREKGELIAASATPELTLRPLVAAQVGKPEQTWRGFGLVLSLGADSVVIACRPLQSDLPNDLQKMPRWIQLLPLKQLESPLECSAVLR